MDKSADEKTENKVILGNEAQQACLFSLSVRSESLMLFVTDIVEAVLTGDIKRTSESYQALLDNQRKSYIMQYNRGRKEGYENGYENALSELMNELITRNLKNNKI